MEKIHFDLTQDIEINKGDIKHPNLLLKRATSSEIHHVNVDVGIISA